MAEEAIRGMQTLNPVVGCPIGCRFCYARRIAEKYGMVEDFSQPTFFPNRIRVLSRRKPTVFFLNSMSDVAFWEGDWLRQVMDAVRLNPQHEYLLLTKRPDRLIGSDCFSDTDTVHLGVTVTCARDSWRLDALRAIDVRHRIASFEPMHGPVDQTDWTGIEWAMIGEETGPEADSHRPETQWVLDAVDKAHSEGIPVSIKAPLSSRDELPTCNDMPAAWQAVLEGRPRPGYPSFDALLEAARMVKDSRN